MIADEIHDYYWIDSKVLKWPFATYDRSASRLVRMICSSDFLFLISLIKELLINQLLTIFIYIHIYYQRHIFIPRTYISICYIFISICYYMRYNYQFMLYIYEYII